jgi:hypothetical protein
MEPRLGAGLWTCAHQLARDVVRPSPWVSAAGGGR